MKLCRTCGEEYSDKFVFCPVDGETLASAAAAPEPSAVAAPSSVGDERTTVVSAAAAGAASVETTGAEHVAAAASDNNGGAPPSAVGAQHPSVGVTPSIDPEETVVSQALAPRGEYHLTMLQDEGITRRLSRELRETAHEYELTWPEFKRDPGGFTKRMATGYGQMGRRFFNQPYVPMAVLSGVLGMAILVTMLVFPFNAAYKWFASDGRLVADVGMTLEEVQRRSTLKLAPAAAQGDGSTQTTVSGENLGFDFELANKGLKFEWARAYLLTLNEEQKVREINVELSRSPQAWRELATSVRSLDESLEDRGWRVFTEGESNAENAKFLKASLAEQQTAPPAEGDPGELRWIDRDASSVITFTAKRAEGGGEARYVSYLKVEELTRETLVAMLEIPEEQEKPDEGPAGRAKGTGGGMKPKQEKPGGGGGGGRREALPASFGKVPPGALQQQIVAITPHPPAIKNPSLPVTPHIVADPTLFPPDNRPIPYGDPKSTSTTPSAGPGEGAGIGDGKGTGVGPGEGAGFGPGRGYNTGGGDGKIGGGGPGGGGGGTDYNKTFNAKDVTRKAVLNSKPEPGFTEEARKNNVTGVVKLRLVLGASGSVSNISVVKGLPDGLTERAIAAARRISFTPAQKDGRPVSQWVTIEYNFNIY